MVGVTAMEKSIATVPDCVGRIVGVPLRFNDQNLNCARQGKLGNVVEQGDGGVNG